MLFHFFRSCGVRQRLTQSCVSYVPSIRLKAGRKLPTYPPSRVWPQPSEASTKFAAELKFGRQWMVAGTLIDLGPCYVSCVYVLGSGVEGSPAFITGSLKFSVQPVLVA